MAGEEVKHEIPSLASLSFRALGFRAPLATHPGHVQAMHLLESSRRLAASASPAPPFLEWFERGLTDRYPSDPKLPMTNEAFVDTEGLLSSATDKHRELFRDPEGRMILMRLNDGEFTGNGRRWRLAAEFVAGVVMQEYRDAVGKHRMILSAAVRKKDLHLMHLVLSLDWTNQPHVFREIATLETAVDPDADPCLLGQGRSSYRDALPSAKTRAFAQTCFKTAHHMVGRRIFDKFRVDTPYNPGIWIEVERELLEKLVGGRTSAVSARGRCAPQHRTRDIVVTMLGDEFRFDSNSCPEFWASFSAADVMALMNDGR